MSYLKLLLLSENRCLGSLFDEPIYLIMDNAASHGIVAATERYTRDLLDWYYVEKMHEAPCSPETNMLDLGL
jgi:hypothetical protein